MSMVPNIGGQSHTRLNGFWGLLIGLVKNHGDSTGGGFVLGNPMSIAEVLREYPKDD